MKRIGFIMGMVFFLGQSVRAQENPQKWGIHFSGFVTAEAFYDTRQAVASRDADVYLYPAPVVLDERGADINERGSLNMLSVFSRLNGTVKGPDVLGAKATAGLEFDFAGTSNASVSLLRLRKAFVQLKWERSALLVGKYWHPMFTTSCFPAVSSWGAAVPLSVLSRNPQIRFTHQFTNQLKGMVAAVGQRDFASPGPDGARSDYLRNAGIPEMNGQLEYVHNGLTLGAVAGYKTLVPRLVTAANIKADERLGSWHSSAYLKVDLPVLSMKFQGIYGQNLYNFVMPGGYAVSAVKADDQREYTNLVVASYWTEWITKGERLRYALFAGYTKNNGAVDDLARNEAGDFVGVYGRATNIDHIYRVSPRMIVDLGKIDVMGEVMYTVAAYGDLQADGTVSGAEEVPNTRIQLHVKYSF